MKPVAVPDALTAGAGEEDLTAVEQVAFKPLALVVNNDRPEAEEDVETSTPTVDFKVPDEAVCLETWKFDATPNGLIKRFVAHFGKLFAYRPAEDAWLRWDGKVFRTDHKGQEVMDAVRCVAESIVHVEARMLAANHPQVQTLQQELQAALSSGDKEKSGDLATQLRSLKRRIENEHKTFGTKCQLEAAVRAAANGAQRYLSVPEEHWDGPKHLLNCQNGVVNLRTGELLPHRQSWRFTQITKCDYNPDATSETLFKVLEHLSDGRQGVQEYFQRWIGQAITGEVSAASILYVWGAAQVGKSTLFNSTLYMLGEGGDEKVSFASTAKPEAFQKKTASHDEGFHHLRRCRMICIIEASGGMFDTTKLKAISGGDGWDSRKAGGSSEKYFPRMSIMMTSNTLTVIAPEDKGLMERFQPYEVTRPLPANQRSDSVKKDLQSVEGMEAILAWAVKGAMSWYADGANKAALKAPAFFADQLAEYTRDMDTIQGWLDDNIVLVDKAHLGGFPHKAIDLFKNYTEYTRGKGLRKARFYHELAQQGFERTQNIRWTLKEGSRKGESLAPASWVPGLYIATGWGDYNYGDKVDNLGGNIPLDPNYLIDNGCEGEGCRGCVSASCRVSNPGAGITLAEDGQAAA